MYLLRLIFSAVTVAVALSITASVAMAKSPPPGSEVDYPANIMLMLDNSASMGWTLGATFDRPYDIAVDGNGNIYLSERYNNKITKFDSSGNVLLSWGQYGTGAGQFRYPEGIAVDGSNNLYVADQNNHRIQKFASDGSYLGVIGEGTLFRPRYLAIDAANSLYVTEYYRDRVTKFGADGTLLTQWGSRGSTAGAFRSPRGITVDHHNHVFVADSVNHRIQKFTSNGEYINQIGGYGTATGEMIFPSDIAYGESGDVLYVADRYNNRIQRFRLADIPDTLNTELSASEESLLNGNALVWGSYGSSDGQFNFPYGVGVLNQAGYSDGSGLSDGDVLVAGYSNNRFQRFSSGGVHEQTVGATSRLEQAKRVIKSILSDSDITQGASFGLILWNSSADTHTCVSSGGAARIKGQIDSVTATGGTNLDLAMVEAQSRFDSTCWHYDSSQCVAGGQSVDLQKNFMIVISDGVWSGHEVAENIVSTMYADYGVKTFVVGFMLGEYIGDSNYQALAEAGNPGLTPPATPLYAENWEQLYAQLALAIRKAINERLELSYTSPVTMPSLRKGNALYRSHFIYQQSHQWQGHLSKYALSNSDGTLLEPALWNAGEVLNSRSPDDRKIFTVASELPTPAESSYNNFTESNLDLLASTLYPGSLLSGQDPIPLARKLIRFVRGYDAYDEYSDANSDANPAPSADWRWKLADIYHAEVAIVSAPDALVTDEVELGFKESYQRYSSGYEAFRLAHAGRREMVYAGSNSGLLHAFNSSDGSEAWAFLPPPLLDKLNRIDVHTQFPNTSNSIFGIDGSVIVKDVRIGGEWKTVLLGGFGAGGNGYFALDVTDPDLPQHLFSMENRPEHDLVRVWSGDGTLTEHSYAPGNTIDPKWDYALLGESWSTPIISSLNTDAGRRWVAIFGNGYNQNSAEIDRAALFVMDLENGGELLLKAELDEVSGELVNSVTAAPLGIDADSVAEFRYGGVVVYIPDFEGTLWKVDLSDAVEAVPLSSTTLPVARVGKLFRDSAMSANNGRLVYYGATAAKGVPGPLWLYYSTSDQSDFSDLNDRNRLYGIIDPEFPSPRVTLTTASIAIEPTLMDAGNLSLTASAGQNCPPVPERGWYTTLPAGDKVTDRANVKNGTVYFPLFTPKRDNLCGTGVSTLVGVDMYCGNTNYSKEMGAGVLKGGVHHRGQTYYSLGGQVQNVPATADDPWSIQNNVVVSPSTENRIIIDGWREKF